MDVSTKTIGEIEGKIIISYTMQNDHGMKMTVLNLGCIITEILTPDREGNFENIVVGYKNIEDYLSNPHFFGAIIGRVAGRIKDAEFQLDGVSYQLAKNDGENHLHGGEEAFHKKIWDGRMIHEENQVGVEFTYLSKDGEEGYPGNVSVSVTYLLNNDNEWTQIITGETDKKTLLNLTNHSYFNLSGSFKRGIQDHKLKINSDHVLELDNACIPTGEMLEVDGTIFDLRKGRELKEVLQSNDPRIKSVGNGFDHPFVLDKQNKIILSEQESGRKLNIETNQPCVVIYTSNNVDDEGTMPEGIKTYKHCAVCLETQGPPDAIHHPQFPSVILNPDGKYHSVTKYHFTID